MLIALGMAPAAALAAESKSAGKLASESATIFMRAEPGSAWQAAKQGQDIPTGQLLLGTPGAAITSANGAVRLTFYLDLDEISPLPTIESAAVLNPAANADLDLNLQRGRVDLTNLRESGAAHVLVHYHGHALNFELQEPGSRVALEMCGRWAPGTRFSRKGKTMQEPNTTLIALVLKGNVTIKEGKNTHALKAPPGPALLQWDCVAGCDEQATTVEKLPAWANPEATTDLAKKKLEILAKFREKALTTDVKTILADMLNSDDVSTRRLAVRACGAFDELALLGDALYSGKYPELWDQTVVVLRHWLGREAGQDKRLYDALVERRKISEVHAESIINLLHSFGEADLSRPETYETLIEYLRHKTLPIRGLAAWHLKRLVPAGRNIAYNPSGTPEELEAAYEAWKKLVPPGQVPARGTVKKEE
jgi:hypothetical protein